jgi:hypothetical protein
MSDERLRSGSSEPVSGDAQRSVDANVSNATTQTRVGVERDRKYLGKAVENGVLKYTSVSALAMFNPAEYGGCNRRWYLRYVDGRKEEKSKARDLGDDVHEQLKHYLRTGEDVLGKEARAGMRFIPTPGSDLLVEEEFEELLGKPFAIAGVPLVGYIDVINPRGEWLDNDGKLQQDPPNTIEVIDWKTTSNLANAKHASELIKTTQMSVYGALVVEGVTGTEWVRLSHGVFGTRKREARKESTRAGLTELAEQRYITERLVGEMKHVAAETDYKKVNPNWEACDAWRGCPHKALCPRVDATRKEQIMSLLSKIKKTNPTPVAAAVEPPPAPPALESSEDKAKRLEAEIAALRAKADALAPITTPITETRVGHNLKVGDTMPSDGAKIVAEPKRGEYIVEKAQPDLAGLAAREAAPSPAPVEEKPKRARRMKIADVSTPAVEVPAADGETTITVRRATVRHSFTVNLGNYQSARAEVELEADVSGADIEKAVGHLGERVKHALTKELEEYMEMASTKEAK